VSTSIRWSSRSSITVMEMMTWRLVNLATGANVYS